MRTFNISVSDGGFANAGASFLTICSQHCYPALSSSLLSLPSATDICASCTVANAAWFCAYEHDRVACLATREKGDR
jgi:hypothetical protein